MKTMLFNPYTGTPRHPSDIQSDPSGLLMLDPDEPVLAYTAPPKAQPMSDEQADQLADLAFIGYMENRNDDDARALVRLVERHHKIGD